MAKTPTWVALGDSTGTGFGAEDRAGYVDRVYSRLRALSPQEVLLNLSVNGATSHDVRTAQLPRALAARPRAATLFFGGNDLWRGIPPLEFGRNLDAIVPALKRAGANLVLGTVVDLSHAPAAPLAEQFLGITRAALSQRAAAFNVEVARVASTHEVRVVDLASVRLAETPHYFSGDGFHPSSAGYAAWAELLWPAVAIALGVTVPS